MREPGVIHLEGLVRLRAGAIAGQLTAILVVHWVLAFALPLAPLLSIVALEGFSNLLLSVWARRARAVGDGFLAAVMAGDVLVLTALLYFSGGPYNPFSFLYLVQLALAAVVLPPKWTWGLLGLSLLAFGALFLLPTPDAGNPAAHAIHMRMHLQGMWVAFGVAASFITYFLYRVTRELHASRERAQRSEKLASLATLAAGAAHELSTPLSTIAVVAKELERALEAGKPASAEDAQLIRAQVERCRKILLQLSADAGTTAGEAPGPTPVPSLLAQAMDGLAEAHRVHLTTAAATDVRVWVPARATAQALRGVLKNALQASPPEAPVEVEALVEDQACVLFVRDAGAGMAPEVLSRAGEPFFTTKAPGVGMGLGLFLAREVLQRFGGALVLSSSPGQGTTATVRLAREAPP